MQFDKEEIVKKLREGVCKVAFTKANGETRLMHCTLNEALLPEMSSEEVDKTATKRKDNPDTLAVWDVEKDGWRAFRWDSLKTFGNGYNV